MNEEKYRAQIMQPNETFYNDPQFVSFAKETLKNDLIAKLSEIITEDAPKLVTLSKPTMREIQPWNDTVMRQDITVRDLVFCKDCKYYEKIFGKMMCRHFEHNTKFVDFCSNGERRETDD